MDMTPAWLKMNPLAQAGALSMADPAQAEVSNPIPAMLRAPVQMGAQPTDTSAQSVAQSAIKQNPVVRPKAVADYLKSDPGEDEAGLLGLRTAAAQSKTDQEAELAGIQDYINAMKNQPQEINFTPLGAYVDSLRGTGNHFESAAQAMAPMSADQKQKQIADLQLKFLGGRAAISRENQQALQNQIAQQMAQRKQDELERFHTGMLQQGAARADAMGNRVLTQQDAQSQRAADVFDKNPIITEGVKRFNQIGIDKHTIQSAKVITPQMLDELAGGIGTALNGGRAAGLGMTQMQQISSAQADLAKLRQYVEGKPYNALSKENRAQLDALFDRLQGGYGNIISQQADNLRKGRSFAHNAHGNTIYDAKHAEYKAYGDGSTAFVPGNNFSAAPASGKVTVTNGSETLQIDAADVAHATADGYQVVK